MFVSLRVRRHEQRDALSCPCSFSFSSESITTYNFHITFMTARILPNDYLSFFVTKTTMMACSQVLETPELLTIIFRHLAGDARCGGPALFAAVCVNSKWFDIAIKYLWTIWSSNKYSDELPNSRSTGALAGIDKRGRRQVYADMVKVLRFFEDDEAEKHRLFAGLRFPRLTDLVVTGPGDCCITQYIQPSLETLAVLNWSEKCSKDFLDFVAENCPRLRSITLQSFGDHISPRELVKYFSRSGQSLQLVDLEFRQEYDVCFITDNLIYQLSRMKLLRSLYISGCGTERIQMKQLDYTPFPSLVDLSLGVLTEPNYLVTHLAPNVERLQLISPNTELTCFNHVAEMMQLRELTIDAWDDVPITSVELLALAPLQQLEKLSIDVTIWDGEPAVADLADLDVDRFVSGLARLTHLCLKFELGIPTAAITLSLSKYCLRLRHLELAVDFDVSPLVETVTPLFPVLTFLRLKKFYVPDNHARLSAVTLARCIGKHAPQLKEIQIKDDAKSKKIVDTWRGFFGSSRS